MDTSKNGRVERLNLAFNYLKRSGIAHSVTHLAQLMGRTRSTVSNAINGVPACINEKFLSEFCGTFPCINSEWLLTGEGEMLVSVQPAPVNVPSDLLERLYSELHALRKEVADLRVQVTELQATPAAPRRYRAGISQPLSLAAEP